ncbi:Rv3235 family protein [Sphaerisporangium krabiense]|uniref:Uncharacterized protein n=1 Tax=Sphaerisporangium krabiense TaxID=763782 RepID=A0A7W9DMR0_9ACTN|nr:Rv3235 family protein [Sphaerisporangium krabiense]MBB5624622.1 hypothetical protein [Sphaerisporangium krabiense]
MPLPHLGAVPPADPPYDEERRTVPRGPAAPAHGPRPRAHDPAHDLAHVRARAAPRERRRDDPGAMRRARRADGAPPGERGLRALGQALAEVLAGRRPPAGVAGHLTERAYAELVRAGRMIETRRPPLAGAPHVHRPRDGVVEACLLVHCGERSRVLALRVERRGTQWLCTEFETA